MSSRVRLVVVMDPIEAIKPAKDSTLAILLAAQARGWQLFYAEQKDLWLRDGVAWGRLAPLQVFDDLRTWFARGATQSAKLGEFDVILMRKDPPFDTEYIYTTYILDRAAAPGRAGVQPAAGPAGHEREGLHGLVSRVLRAHPHHPRHARHERIPARARQGGVQAAGRHGRQVHFRAGTGRQEPQCRVRDPDRLRHAAMPSCSAICRRSSPPAIAGSFWWTESRCRSRLQRIPTADDNRGNLAAGARAESRPLNERDRWLCSQIGPKLKAAGMIFVGLDVIGDYVTEINVTSPTGHSRTKQEAWCRHWCACWWTRSRGL